MTKRQETFTCPTCHQAFRHEWPRQKFCGTYCAVSSRISVLEDRDSCWLWTGALNNMGYGQIGWNHQAHYVHRIVLEFATGPLTGGLQALHRCDNPPCCNPHHLFAGSQADNLADMRRKNRQGPRLGLIKGSAHYKAKLSEADVRYIRERIALGTLKRPLAREMGVSQGTIQDIAAGRTWSHL